jgi:hypothetical protein
MADLRQEFAACIGNADLHGGLASGLERMPSFGDRIATSIVPRYAWHPMKDLPMPHAALTESRPITEGWQTLDPPIASRAG